MVLMYMYFLVHENVREEKLAPPLPAVPKTSQPIMSPHITTLCCHSQPTMSPLPHHVHQSQSKLFTHHLLGIKYIWELICVVSDFFLFSPVLSSSPPSSPSLLPSSHMTVTLLWMVISLLVSWGRFSLPPPQCLLPQGWSRSSSSPMSESRKATTSSILGRFSGLLCQHFFMIFLYSCWW